MRKNLFISILIVLFALPVINAQNGPKREMRSAWITTVWGLDWPTYTITSTGDLYTINQQKDQIVALLDQLKSANMNSVFFQVRSECDAMYQSSYEPWSAYLVSPRGMDPGYDPLAFVVEECHKRGMEIHAWLNPYRFESSAGKYEGMAGDYRVTHPEWVLEYPDKADGSKNVSILDPGNPGVRQRITDITREIITNYDVDGIVFDDYFYAYGGTPSDLDAYSQNLYKPSGMDLHDWRRDNVNQMVSDVYEMIQSVKPYVTFGLSPFGIWTTDHSVAAAEGLELPDGITGMNAYQQIYCDPIAWLKAATVDYISPQLYWPTTSTGQDYDVLAPWWSEVCNLFGRHLYVSHTLSGLAESDYAPSYEESPLKSISKDTMELDLKGLSMLEYFSQPDDNLYLKGTLDPSEFGAQVQINRSSDKNGAPGSVFFRASMFYRTGFVNYLTDYEFADKALTPAINWKTFQERGIPTNLSIESNTFMWDSPETGVRYSVYAIPNTLVGTQGIFASSEHLIGVAYQKSFDLTGFLDLVDTHSFAVAVLDRYGNEFPPAMVGHTPDTNQAPELLYPVDNQDAFNPFSFSWGEVTGADSYVFEVAEDVAFENVIYRRSLDVAEFSATNVSMETGQAYYWRVSSRKIGVSDEVSSIRSFNLVPQPSPEILSPEDNSAGVSLTPLIEWADFGAGFTYELQISLNSDFSSIAYSVGGIEGLSHQIPENILTAWSTYYIRVKAGDGQSVSAWSPVVLISTLQVVPDIPVIVSPVNGASLDPQNIAVSITEEPYAKSFTVHMSSQDHFPWTDRKVFVMDAFQYELALNEIQEGNYYLRVRADYSVSSYTEWSDVVSFNVVTTSIGDSPADRFYLQCPTLLDGQQAAIRFGVPARSHVRLFLSDISGRQVKLLRDEVLQKGEHSVLMNTNDLMKGLYFLTIQTPDGKRTLKLIR